MNSLCFAQVTFTITFSEEVTNFDVNKLTVTANNGGTATPTITSVTANKVWIADLTVSGTLVGELTIQILASAGLTDNSGNVQVCSSCNVFSYVYVYVYFI
jgi:hypothetical protein